MFIAALFTIATIWKQRKCPSSDEWIKKMWYIYIQWNTSQPYKRMTFCHLQQHGWTRKGIMLSEISQRKTNTVRCQLYVESKNKLVNITEKKQTHRYTE